MRILRFADGQSGSYGTLEGEIVYGLDGGIDEEPRRGPEVGPLADLELLVPCEPTKVICVGRNYAGHIKEMGRPWPEEPHSFLKGPNTIVAHQDPVLRPPDVQDFDYEGELAVVIGRTAKSVTEGSWRDFVRGYTCANDLTVRDWQRPESQWLRAKGSDTLCPLGPWVETAVTDAENLRIQTRVNGEVRQDGSTSDFVFGIGALLEFLTATITLEPGDVVLTGTPGGVGGVVGGDVVEVEIEGIGTLSNPIKQT